MRSPTGSRWSSGGEACSRSRIAARVSRPVSVKAIVFTRRSVGIGRRSTICFSSSRSTIQVTFDASQRQSLASSPMARGSLGSIASRALVSPG